MKNNDYIKYELELDMASFVIKPHEDTIYELYAVSNHSGSFSGGHYTAYCKYIGSNEWSHFNDSSVNEIRDPTKSP